MSRLLTFQYYFTMRPDPNFQYTTIVAVAILLLFIASVAIKVYQVKYAQNKALKKSLVNTPTSLAYFGSVLLFLLLSREAGIPLFSMRIWWFIWMISLVVWGYFFIKNTPKKYKALKERTVKVSPKSKYLPKKKKRRSYKK